MPSKSVRVRFAPSPTGYLHVGGARTALYNYLFAKKNGGTFILRIEDTDLERSTEESMKMQMADLKWLGLDWDEGPDFTTLKDRGAFAPYRQSVRKEQGIYRRYADRLIEQGRAYRCYHSDEELEKEREEGAQGVQHECEYRDSRLELDKPYVVRFKKPMSAAEFSSLYPKLKSREHYLHQDMVRGEVVFPFDMVGDFVLIRSNGMPVYNFCCAIDDYEMKITHVFRAEEHLSNTLRQFWVYAAICPDRTPEDIMPQFGHMSLILGPDKQKLSKRHGATSCHEYMQKGYLPEALNNFIALLGWSPGNDQEILSREEMISKFSEERLVKSPAVFDEVKLKWVNATHLRALPNLDVWKRAEPFLQAAGLKLNSLSDTDKNSLVETFKPSVETLCDLAEKLGVFSDEAFQISEDGKEALKWESSRKLVEKWRDLLNEKTERVTAEEFAKMQDRIKNECGVKGKFLFMPLRVCVIGQPHGVDIAKIIGMMDRTSLSFRAQRCLEAMG